MKVEKRIVDLFIQARRDYFSADWEMKKRFNEMSSVFAKVLEKETGVDWISWSDLLWSILGTDGFMPGATNEDFYRVLNALGLEVVNEIGNSD